MGNGYVVPGASWEHVPPAAAGFSSARLEVLQSWLKTQPSTAMIAVYKGRIFFQYGDTTRATNVASVRKSVLDLLYAAELKNIKQGINYSSVVQLGLQDKVPFIHPEDSANFDQLLTSRSGIYIPNGDGDQDAVAPRRGSEYPGTHFFYNNWDFNALGTAFCGKCHGTLHGGSRACDRGPGGCSSAARPRRYSSPQLSSAAQGRLLDRQVLSGRPSRVSGRSSWL